jgi:hypothetical protein
MWHNADLQTQCKRVDRWCNEYRALANKHGDAHGIKPKHTFFYPEEEYVKEHLDKLARLCKEGLGEIEIHLHHNDDTESNFIKTMQNFINTLDENHDAICKDKQTGEKVFSFIHGNWALDNSRKDGKWCGLNNEITLLKQLGCYADFTLPSAPSDTQTSKINSIYYAIDDSDKPKSHNTGCDVEVGKHHAGDLMIIQGPLSLNWKDRKWGIFPRIENSDIRSGQKPTPDRVDLWVRTGITVKNKPDWIFVKIHTHGTQENDMDTLLGDDIDNMFTYLEENYNDGENYKLHYVSARELYNIVKAAEDSRHGDPHEFRDYRVDKPGYLLQ